MRNKIFLVLAFILLASIGYADNALVVRNGNAIRTSHSALGAKVPVTVIGVTSNANSTLNVTTYSSNSSIDLAGYVGLKPYTVTTSAQTNTINVITGLVEGDEILLTPFYDGQTFIFVAGSIIKTSDGANLSLTNNYSSVRAFCVSSNYIQLHSKRNY